MDLANRTSADLQRLTSSLPEFLSLADPDIAQMHPLQRAESMLALSKAASSLLSLRLGCAGVNPADHSIKSELERINLYEAKLERFMDLNKEKSEWVVILEKMVMQEKALKGVRKRKWGEEYVAIISSSPAKESSAVALEKETASEDESTEGEALVRRPRKIRIRTPNFDGNSPPAASQELDHFEALAVNNPTTSELAESCPSGQIEPVGTSLMSLDNYPPSAERQSVEPTGEESLPSEGVPVEGLLNDVGMQLRFTNALQRFRGELPPIDTRDDLFSYARYHSLVGAMIPGMLMEAWRQERFNILELESQVRRLTKKRHNWRKQHRNMRASIQDLKTQVDAAEAEITDAREEIETLREQLAAEREERERTQVSWSKESEDLNKQLEAERAGREQLQAQWITEREQLQEQIRESSLALSRAASEKAQEIKRTKQEAVETFKSSDAFIQELVSRSGKAMEESLRSIRNDLQRLYPNIDLSVIPGLDYLRRLDEVRSVISSPESE